MLFDRCSLFRLMFFTRCFNLLHSFGQCRSMFFIISVGCFPCSFIVSAKVLKCFFVWLVSDFQCVFIVPLSVVQCGFHCVDSCCSELCHRFG